VYKKLLTNHPLVNILFTVVLVMGIMSYTSMPREQDPEINFNWVNVQTVLPGASAEDVEELVTGPLEDAVRNVQDIRWVISSTRESISNIIIRFRDLSPRVFDKRVNDLRRELQAKTNDELPDDVEDPYIIEVTTSSGFPTALVVVEGQANDEQLRVQARQIKEDLTRMTGVDKVIEIGLQDPELQVEFIPRELAARGLLATDIADSLGRAFRDTFAGRERVSNSDWLLRVHGAPSDPELLGDFQLAPAMQAEQLIPLGDVAEIKRGREEARALVSQDGNPAIALSVTKVSYTNTLQLVDRINEYIERKNRVLEASGLRVQLADDQTTATRQAISIMQTNALLGLILVLGVCWAFLGIRIASLVTLGIVFSVTGTFWTLNFTGNTLNVSVLLGIVIVLGMLVDDAVVVVEAMYYRLQRGAKAMDAAIDSMREVGQPVTSAVMTTMAAFLPLMLLPGIVGKFMFVIPFVVTVGLAISLIEAFWILPSHVLGLHNLSTAISPENSFRVRWTHWIRVKYTKALCYVMRRPARFIVAGLIAFTLAISAVGGGLVRIEFFVTDPIRLFYINVDMPADAPLEETLKQALALEGRARQLLEEEEIRSVTSWSGVQFTDTEALFGDQYGQIQVSLNPRASNGRTTPQIIEDLREFVLATPSDGVVSFFAPAGGPPSSLPISVKVRADDFEELRSATDMVLDIVRKLPGTRDISDNDVEGRSELQLTLDYKAIRRAGLSPAQVARLVRLHSDGEIVAFVRNRGEKVELRVRGLQSTREDISSVLDEPIALPGGGITSFGALASSGTGQGRGTIHHFNLRRSISVEGDIDPSITNTVEVNRRLEEAWEKIAPQYPNTDLDFSGELDDIQESLDSMAALFLLGVGLIYLIIATQFRSYFQPLLILVTVPMAFTGVVFGLLLTGNPLSLYTLYGIIALTGIAVNSAIVMIDAANSRIKAGMRPLHATVYAARRRVVPVLMTTTTTIAGLFSLAVGLGGKSLIWGPVASSIVAGLGVASLMTLFLVPTLYRIFQRGHGGDEFIKHHNLE